MVKHNNIFASLLHRNLRLRLQDYFSPLFTIVVALSFGFRSATTTDSSLYLTFISSNSIYEQTCFYCLWNDCNYNFVALFFYVSSALSPSMRYLFGSLVGNLLRRPTVLPYSESLSLLLSHFAKRVSWAERQGDVPRWDKVLLYQFNLWWFTYSHLGTSNSRYCKRARFCLFHSTCSSRRCKMQLNLSLIVFCESLAAAVSFCEWILFVITSEQQPTC